MSKPSTQNSREQVTSKLRRTSGRNRESPVL